MKDSTREAAQALLDKKFEGKYTVIPNESIKQATVFLEHKWTTAYSRPTEAANLFGQAGIARLFLLDIFELKTEAELSKVAEKAKKAAGVKQ